MAVERAAGRHKSHRRSGPRPRQGHRDRRLGSRVAGRHRPDHGRSARRRRLDRHLPEVLGSGRPGRSGFAAAGGADRARGPCSRKTPRCARSSRRTKIGRAVAPRNRPGGRPATRRRIARAPVARRAVQLAGVDADTKLALVEFLLTQHRHAGIRSPCDRLAGGAHRRRTGRRRHRRNRAASPTAPDRGARRLRLARLWISR